MAFEMEPAAMLYWAMLFLLAAIIAIIVYVFARGANETTTHSRKYRKLGRKREELERLLEKIRFEYFKRHLSEQEYKYQVLRAQNELDGILGELGKIEKSEGENAWEKRKRKRYIRDVQKALRGRAKKFSREEMRELMKEQHYSKKEIERILKEMF